MSFTFMQYDVHITVHDESWLHLKAQQIWLHTETHNLKALIVVSVE